MRAALEQLHPTESAVLQLAYLDRLTYKQVSVRLRLPERRVNACAAAALGKLSQILHSTSLDAADELHDEGEPP